MRRIFLLLEDFTELTFLETLLKKVGFDTLGSQSLQTGMEKALTLSPDMVILSDIIKSQSTHEVLENFKKYRSKINVILLKRDLKYITPHKEEHIDAVVKSPVDPELFLRTIAKVADLNDELIIEKFHKLGLFKGTKVDDKIIVPNGDIGTEATETVFVRSMKNTDSKSQEESRKKRFQKQLESLEEPKVKVIDHNTAVKEAHDFRSRSGDPEIKNIDEVRKNFVKALFKK